MVNSPTYPPSAGPCPAYGIITADSQYDESPEYDMEKGNLHEASTTSTSAAFYGPVPAVRKKSLEKGDVIDEKIDSEAGNAIKYRTCSWQKIAMLLLSQYICIGVMGFPWSYSVLGLVPGLLLTIVVAASVLYTSYVVWQVCLRHPEIRDICDFGQYVFFGSEIAWYLTAVMFLLNNTFLQALHCLVGSQYLNTITRHSRCTVIFAALTAIISLACSIPRTFRALAMVANFTATLTFMSLVLVIIFSAIEPHLPEDDPMYLGEPIIRAFPQRDTTFVSAMSAFFNICYTLTGQLTLPSFISEMENPRDFGKALWIVTACEMVIFGVVGGTIYAFTGNQYVLAPAFGALRNRAYKLISFSFAVPALIFLGILYASVSARFIFFRLFENSQHKSSHTLIGWASWTGILAVLWFLAFIIAEIIPFFNDLLSIMSSVFHSFFGFIFYGVAYFRVLYDERGGGCFKRLGMMGWMSTLLNVLIIGAGIFFLGPGTYTSIESVAMKYREGSIDKAFSCTDNGM